MSSKIEGILPHRITSYAQIEALPERLRVALPALTELHRSYWERLESAEPFEPVWHVGLWSMPSSGLTPRDEWERGHGPRLYAGKTVVDFGSWVVFGPKCVFVTTGVKWWVAVERPELFQKARAYFRDLAVVLESNAYVLHRQNDLSWNWVHEGKSFEEIESEFLKQGSMGVADLDELRTFPPGKKVTGYNLENLY